MKTRLWITAILIKMGSKSSALKIIFFVNLRMFFSWVKKSFWSAEGICAQGNLTMAKFERLGKRTASSNFLFSFFLNSFFGQGNVPMCRKSLTNGFVPPVYQRRNSQRKKIPHRGGRLKCTKAFLCTGPQHRLKTVVHACSSSNKIASVVRVKRINNCDVWSNNAENLWNQIVRFIN